MDLDRMKKNGEKYELLKISIKVIDERLEFEKYFYLKKTIGYFWSILYF